MVVNSGEYHLVNDDVELNLLSMMKFQVLVEWFYWFQILRNN